MNQTLSCLYWTAKSSVNVLFNSVGNDFFVTFFSGTLSFHDVMYAGGHSEMEELHVLQQRLQFDDPINIQFTSVRTRFFIFIQSVFK